MAAVSLIIAVLAAELFNQVRNGGDVEPVVLRMRTWEPRSSARRLFVALSSWAVGKVARLSSSMRALTVTNAPTAECRAHGSACGRPSRTAT
eukprot:scaffold3740_cov322-Prasinococcus_capsulatus_cf.AAC.8